MCLARFSESLVDKNKIEHLAKVTGTVKQNISKKMYVMTSISKMGGGRALDG